MTGLVHLEANGFRPSNGFAMQRAWAEHMVDLVPGEVETLTAAPRYVQ